jgi:tetratricopeptide (TPR) repeat protein
MSNKMTSEDMNDCPEEFMRTYTEEEMKVLTRKVVRAKHDLGQTTSRRKRQKIKDYIDEMNMDLGYTFLDLKEYEKALAVFSTVSYATHGEMKFNGMAWALTEMGHYDEARRLLEMGLKRFPQSYALWVAMGALYDSLGEDFESLKCTETALQFAPEDNAGGLYNKAVTLRKLGCYGDARPIIDDLIERYPEDPTYVAERGVIALDTGYPGEALQYYQRAMGVWQFSPNADDGVCIYTGLCTAYLELGMKREGMEIALEGLKKFPDEDPMIYQNVGATFFGMGWRNECMEILKKGTEKFPEDEELKKFLKHVEDDLDDPDGGEKPPLLGFLLLMALLHRRGRKK